MMHSDAWHLYQSWQIAAAEVRARAAEAQRVWAEAVNVKLTEAGVFDRVANTNKALGSRAFERAMGARRAEREAAKDEEDIRRIALSILAEMGIDQTDVLIRLRRLPVHEMPQSLRRSGAVQLSIGAYPTVPAAQRAIDAAAEDGIIQPSVAFTAGDDAPLVAGTGVAEQVGQGTIGT